MADDEKPSPTDAGTEPPDEEDALGAPATEAATKTPRMRLRRTSGGEPRAPTRLPLRRAALLIVVPILVIALAPFVFGAFKKTPRNQIGISYGGGPLEGSHFQRVVKPGSGLFFNGWLDKLYLYPADARNYIITKVAEQGSTKGPDSVIAPSRDRVQVEYQIAVYFKLNTDRLRAFHEQLGLKYAAYTSSGWGRLIQDTFRQQIENTLQAETRRHDVAELYSDADLLTTIQRQAQTSLRERLVRAMGQEYFCGPTFEPGGRCTEPTFVIKKIDIPKNVVTAFEDNRTSQVQILTKQNEIQQRAAEAEAISVLNDQLAIAGENYVLLRAIESGKVNFWVIPQDSGLTLQAPATPPSGG